MPSVFISAAHKSSGKTTLSIGLCAALKQSGLKVQSFKKGPDYIDPMWLSAATGQACYNLDFFTMNSDEINSLYSHYSNQSDISIVEGNKGLYDGLDLQGGNSNAALASSLKLPIILVLDARGMTRGIAPLVLGYQAFDRTLNISAVILNQVGGSRHESKLRAILEYYTDVSLLGAVHRHADLTIDERHLGLIPSNESERALSTINCIAQRVADQVDLQQLITLAGTAATPVDYPAVNHRIPSTLSTGLKIGIIRDSAFGFYYPDDISAIESAGAEIVYIDSTQDTTLPPLDGLFIGGGFPETQLSALSANKPLRSILKLRIEQGLPTYAECGGLMYLTRSIQWKDKKENMVGVIPGEIIMHDKPQGRGYVKLTETKEHPWPGAENHTIHAHEFHYSSLINLPKHLKYAYHVERGTGIDGVHDGLLMYNLVANYTHFRNLSNNAWVKRFLLFIQSIKAQNKRPKC